MHTPMIEWVRDLANVLAATRDWHRREQNRYELHPAVVKALSQDHRPTDWHLLVLQWPHKSVRDAARLAYTLNERKAEADQQTVTSTGKYLRQHFPTLADHDIRDIVAFVCTEGVEIVGTAGGIVAGIQEGPRSCMKWENHEIASLGHGHHPYEVYAPEFGWRMAIRRNDDGRIDGRALLLLDDPRVEGKGVFVRSYRRCIDDDGNEGYSYADEKLAAWLEDNGFQKRDEWPDGTKLKRINVDNDVGVLCPYIDGGTQRVDVRSGYLLIDRDGEYEADNTDGSLSGQPTRECDDCGDDIPERDQDEGQYVGRGGNRWVCYCCSDNYVHGYGRYGDSYYMPEDETVEVDGDHYHRDYLGDNDIVQLDNGDYCREDDAFHCPIREAWFHCDDGKDTEDMGTVHEDEVWECAGSGNTYSTRITPVEIDGESYHPDHVPEDEDQLSLLEAA